MINSKNTVVFSGVDLDSPLRRENVNFNRLVMFWNGETPGNSFFNLNLRVRPSGGDWEPWVKLGTWGKGISSKTLSPRGKRFKVSIDTLVAEENCDAFELGIEAEPGKNGEKPLMFLVGATFWDVEDVPPQINSDWTGEISVPKRSQMVQDSSDRRVICSPTCLAMVMEFYGKNLPTLEVARGVFDHGPGIYGNWPFNTALAGSMGFPAFVHRLSGMGEAREWLAAGTPLIASIAYKKGELTGAPQEKSNGHLVVMTGFLQENGAEYVVTNDPAAPGEKTVRRKYRREEFERAWNRIAYILFSH